MFQHPCKHAAQRRVFTQVVPHGCVQAGSNSAQQIDLVGPHKVGVDLDVDLVPGDAFKRVQHVSNCVGLAAADIVNRLTLFGLQRPQAHGAQVARWAHLVLPTRLAPAAIQARLAPAALRAPLAR